MDTQACHAKSSNTKSQDKEEKDKRVSKKRRFESLNTVPTKYDGKIGLWTDEHLTKLIEHLTTNGFDGDYQTIQNMFPNFSENTIKSFFNQLSRWSEPVIGDPTTLTKAANKRGDIPPAPVEEWITTIRECNEVQRLGVDPPLILEWIAKFEEHPDPAECCGVDYKAIYLYISALLEGHIPKQLDPPSASKLYLMFQQLVNTISQSAKTSQTLLLKTVTKTQVGFRVERDEKNRILRERRRAVWTEEELEQARIVKSDDLDQIKKLFCDKPGLNPFCFPPSI